MPGTSLGELSPDVEAALNAFVDAGCPEEVNAYLEKVRLSHPKLRHERRQTMPAHEEIPVLPCERGFRSKYRWVPDKHGGHLFVGPP
jgi:hypothetical protein